MHEKIKWQYKSTLREKKQQQSQVFLSTKF